MATVEKDGKENIGEAKKFTPETRSALENHGYTILTLRGAPLKQVLQDFRQTDIQVYFADIADELPVTRQVEASRASEIALLRNNLYLPGSYGATNQDHPKKLAEVVKMLQKRKITQVEPIIGNLTDYLEIVYQYYKRSWADIFHDVFGSYVNGYIPGLVSTTSNIPEYDGFEVGHTDLGKKVIWIIANRNPSVRASHLAPLIVPR